MYIFDTSLGSPKNTYPPLPATPKVKIIKYVDFFLKIVYTCMTLSYL